MTFLCTHWHVCRAYDEVGWHNKLPSPLPPPSTAVEPLADQVSLRFTMKRYDAEPADWQVHIPSVDKLDSLIIVFNNCCTGYRDNMGLHTD